MAVTDLLITDHLAGNVGMECWSAGTCPSPGQGLGYSSGASRILVQSASNALPDTVCFAQSASNALPLMLCLM